MYGMLVGEMEDLKSKIDKLEEKSALVADVVQNGYKGRAVIRGYDIKREEKLKYLREKYQERYDLVLEQKNQIEEFIKNIKKTEIRQIFEHRYIDGMNWVQIQFLMNIKYKTDRYNEDKVRMKHDRYLKKINKF